MKKFTLLFSIFCMTLFTSTGLNAQSAFFSLGLPGTQCAPADVSFYNSSDTSGLTSPSWEWWINGEYVYDWDPPTQTFGPGWHSIQLTLYDQGVWIDSWNEDIQVLPSITGFNVSSGGQACPMEQLQFWFDENIYFFSIEWYFGDNSVFEDHHRYSHTSHAFYEEGTYDVTLIIDHECGQDTIVQQVNIGPGAKPEVNAYITNGGEFCPSDPVNFGLDYDYTSYLWDFGDGFTSTERNPSHVYPAEAATSYNATITVSNSCGGSDTDTVFVAFVDSMNANAGFNYYYQTQSIFPCPGSPVEFEAWGSGIYSWDFGDGSISNERHAVNYFTQPGQYYITLTVRNGCGDMDIRVDSVTVAFDPGNQPYADFTIELEGTYEDYYGMDTIYVCPGTLLNFRNKSYTFYGASISYKWNFGDGAVSSSRDAAHVYSSAGLLPYKVTLVASNSCGGADTLSMYVVVDDGIMPEPVQGVVPEIICSGEEVFFYLDNGIDQNNYVYDIDFGDGTSLLNATSYQDSMLQTLANHAYSGAVGDTFNYVFSVTNQCGNTNDKFGTIMITGDRNMKPFYYVGNSASIEGGMMEDWSVRKDPSDHEFLIHFAWPGWPGGQDTFAVFFWYEGFNPEYDPGQPNGFVKIITSNVMIGDSVRAYVPVNPNYSPMIGFAVGWTCDGSYNTDTDPEVWGMQLDFIGTPKTSLPLLPGGFSNMASIGNPIILDIDQSWDGLCNSETPDQDYFYQLNAGQYIQLTLYKEPNEYHLYATTDEESYDWITQISQGNYSITGKDTIEFYGWFECVEMVGQYTYSINGDEIDFFLISDGCTNRVKYLTDSTFRKNPHLGGEMMMEEGSCVGDKVQFQVAGGTSYEWHFGDASPVSNQRYPVHIYTVPGDYNAFLVATNSCGRVDTIQTPVRIGTTNLPYAYFDLGGYEHQRLETIQFNYGDTWSDQAGNNSYFWEFGDGSTSTLRDPVHAYNLNGEYTISLTVTNGCGSSTQTQMIYIMDAIMNCEAKIQIDSVMDKTVYLSDISRGNITNWFWDFGDGYTSGQQNPAHTYNYEGIFFVCLSVYDSVNECAHQVCRRVEIGTQLCIADFSAIVNEATKKVQFTDLSMNASEWFWDFGDGSFSADSNPSHAYTDPGLYNVCLSVYDGATDCFAYRCKKIQVGTEDSTFCYANFSYFVNDSSNSVIFTDESSTNITNWYWTFGDGTFIQDRSPVKKYTGPGIYKVCLIVFDENTGCTEEICKEILVGISDCNVSADFAFFIDITNSTVTFNDRSGGTATKWFWSFGDEGTSSKRSPVHKYNAPGFYLVTLSVFDDITGCSDHLAKFIQIGTVDCRAGFEYKVDPTTKNVQFYNQSKGTLSEYFWYFDDGTYSSQKDPMHQFKKAGMYFVSLTVVNSSGTCMDYFFEPIQVGTVNCAANFKYFIDSASNVGYFTPGAIGTASAYLWFFGDGSISTAKNAQHKYTQPGYFTVGLNTYDQVTGCMNYFEEVILIGRKGLDCRAGFSYISDPLTKKIMFADRSKGTIMEYFWEFGDRSYSTDRNPVHQYVLGGYYPVCLTVVNEFGTPNTFCDYVQLATNVAEECFAKFVYSIDSVSKTAEFVQQSNGNPDGYLWNFGDGKTSISENPQHIYTAAGYYLVELSIKNSTTNCSSNRFKLINVAEGNKGLRTAFSYESDSSDLKASSYPVDFVGVSLGDAGKLKWTFGDGDSNLTTMNPTHEYAVPGIYTACLTVSNPITSDENTSCQQVTTAGYVDNTGVDPKSAWNNILSNYPNPFDQITYVVYELLEGSSVDLVLFDQTGRLVDILVREDQISGHYRLEYDGSKLDSGIYTLRLATQQGIYTARMVVR